MRLVAQQINNRKYSIGEILGMPPERKYLLERMLKDIGYPSIENVREEVLNIAKSLIGSVLDASTPRLHFKMGDLEVRSNSDLYINGLKIISVHWSKVASLLEGRKLAVCFGLTIGDQVENIYKDLNKEDKLKGFLWDAICSTLTEYYADRFENYLASKCSEYCLKITRRFSPGYCDLPLREGQEALFNCCNLNEIGISLSESGLMTPRKSITGFILVAEEIPKRTPCSFCETKCKHRRSHAGDK